MKPELPETLSTGKRHAYQIFSVVGKLVYAFASAALFLVSLMMIAAAIWEVGVAWMGKDPGIRQMLDAIGLIVISIAVIDVSKYLMEEEVLRERELRSAREARETLTKFMVIISIAVSLEALVFIFGAGKEDVNKLLFPTLLLLAAGFLTVGLGIFQRLSTTAETERRSSDH